MPQKLDLEEALEKHSLALSLRSPLLASCGAPPHSCLKQELRSSLLPHPVSEGHLSMGGQGRRGDSPPEAPFSKVGEILVPTP